MKCPEATSAQPLLHSHSWYIVKKSLEVGDECEVSLPVEQVDASVVVLVGDVQGAARFAIIVVETEDRNVCLQRDFVGRDLVGFYWVLDLVEPHGFKMCVVLIRAVAVPVLVLGYTRRDDAVSETAVIFILHVENTLLQDKETG